MTQREAAPAGAKWIFPVNPQQSLRNSEERRFGMKVGGAFRAAMRSCG